jgi:ParB/RepB/Spo0J family partition protein
MSNKRGEWIARRGQAGAGAAIERVLDLQPQPHDQVQLIGDEQIEDSPYQARQPITDASVAELAQGKREVDFQGVLIVRPHGDSAKRRRGVYQLVYGHRRRVAWRQVCAERRQACELPIVVREISDTQLLTIGAQENLQRQDLDPIEEAQIVAWIERAFFEKNQAEIGAMLGKSSDWVSVRSRIHKLPDALKACLRQRPQAISQILELGPLAAREPEAADQLARRIVEECLTLDMVRALVRGYVRPERREPAPLQEGDDRRGTTTPVYDVTSESDSGNSHDVCEAEHERRGAAPFAQDEPPTGAPEPQVPLTPHHVRIEQPVGLSSAIPTSAHLTRLSTVTATLTHLAEQADEMPSDAVTTRVLEQAEDSLMMLRLALLRRTLPGSIWLRPPAYRLVEIDVCEALLHLQMRRAVSVELRPREGRGVDIHLLLHVLSAQRNTAVQAGPVRLYIAVLGMGHAVMPFGERLPIEQVQRTLHLSRGPATLVTAFLNDLAQIQTGSA